MNNSIKQEKMGSRSLRKSSKRTCDDSGGEPQRARARARAPVGADAAADRADRSDADRDTPRAGAVEAGAQSLQNSTAVKPAVTQEKLDSEPIRIAENSKEKWSLVSKNLLAVQSAIRSFKFALLAAFGDLQERAKDLPLTSSQQDAFEWMESLLEFVSVGPLESIDSPNSSMAAAVAELGAQYRYMFFPLVPVQTYGRFPSGYTELKFLKHANIAFETSREAARRLAEHSIDTALRVAKTLKENANKFNFTEIESLATEWIQQFEAEFERLQAAAVMTR